jgi:hypothetical protein
VLRKFAQPREGKDPQGISGTACLHILTPNPLPLRPLLA